MAKELFIESRSPFSRLPDLFERLFESLAEFLDAKLALFRKELFEEGESLVRQAIAFVAATLVAWMGFLVVTAGIVIVLGQWLESYVLSAFIIGALYIVIGVVVAKWHMKNLRYPLPKTRIELEKDKQWIKTS